jgi:hypothetical protein
MVSGGKGKNLKSEIRNLNQIGNLKAETGGIGVRWHFVVSDFSFQF